jgi:hypothetical protein
MAAIKSLKPARSEKKWNVGVKLQVNSTAIGVEALSASDLARILNTLTRF